MIFANGGKYLSLRLNIQMKSCPKVTNITTTVSQTRWIPRPTGKLAQKSSPVEVKYSKISTPLGNYPIILSAWEIEWKKIALQNPPRWNF